MNGIIRTNIQQINVPAMIASSGYVTTQRTCDMNILTQKQCTKCGEWKDRSEFNKRKRNEDGLDGWCRVCSNANTNKHVAANIEYYREKARQWFADNTQRRRDSTREYYRNNKEEVIEKQYFYTENRRARLVANGGQVTKKEWGDLKEKHGNKCIYPDCSETKVEMDHVIPLSLGGIHAIGNIQPLCRFHNASKGAKAIDYR